MLSVFTKKLHTHTCAHTHTHTRKFLEMMDMFSTLFAVMVSELYAYVQTNQGVYIKYVQNFVCQWYHNKA